MRTSINGVPAPWTEEIQAKYDKAFAGWPQQETRRVTEVNYFTPRPYRNEYDRGSREEGFVYTHYGIQSYANGEVGKVVLSQLYTPPRLKENEEI